MSDRHGSRGRLANSRKRACDNLLCGLRARLLEERHQTRAWIAMKKSIIMTVQGIAKQRVQHTSCAACSQRRAAARLGSHGHNICRHHLNMPVSEGRHFGDALVVRRHDVHMLYDNINPPHVLGNGWCFLHGFQECSVLARHVLTHANDERAAKGTSKSPLRPPQPESMQTSTQRINQAENNKRSAGHIAYLSWPAWSAYSASDSSGLRTG